MIRDLWEAFGRHDLRVRPSPPSPAAIDRMDEALAWLRWLEPDDARIAWMRASGDRWKSICWKVGLARTAAHRHWLYALCVIAWRLDGHQIPRNILRRRVIEEIQAVSQ